MDTRKPKNAPDGGRADHARTMRALADTLRDATECLLDLQHAVEALHVMSDPALARAVDRETADCLRAAMRGGPRTPFQRLPYHRRP